ncbi:putative calcium/calmodulin-dependent protein kinase [Helianthus annuus]|uniref:Putative calmodulin-binding domain, plant n=1 Tax=Helianthus annuus TaxID=4232 RepID=A0A251VMA7_HELAN|nr:calmodulin binding protein PICBP [Helianthus annuus]KAJ0621865.1 putative calcium/calmodulin-dependent protein kinase [Helianthus annuus]KAJ0626242.1 putative calcium/calmodulin-dependent protein kinase [Helianthus annuus]
METESSLTQEIGENKNPQLDCTSPESLLTPGDSDSESTSVSSSIQGSISSATSSLDRHTTNVKEETRQKKPLNKSTSKKLATFRSFVASRRRRTQSKLSRSSIKLSDDGSTTPPQYSSIEASDESSNYIQKKPIQKFKRTSSLRSIKIFRSNNKNNSSTEESHSKRATVSSILKDSNFPEQLKHQPGPSQAKICPYQHCSLHGHQHEPPQTRFPYLRKRATNGQKIVKPESQPKYKSCGKKREVKGTKMGSKDDSIEFYAKTRPGTVSSRDHGDAEFADILKKDINGLDNRDFSDLIDENIEDSSGSKRVLEKEQSLEKTDHISMWRMIQQHMVSGLDAESGDMIVQQVDEEEKLETKAFDDDANQETEIRKMFAIKLVRDAIENILLSEVEDDQSFTSDQKEESLAPAAKEKPGSKTGAPDRWSYIKKVFILKKFIKQLEKVKKFNPKKAQDLPLPVETETVSLRRQSASGKKNSDEWMLDYALQKVVSELAPTQKRKVAMLVKAFESIAPAQEEESQESRSNSEIQKPNSSFINEESKPELDHIKMWHTIYQHVITDIATKIGSDFGEDSTTSEEQSLEQFTQTDAINLVQQSVNEILLPDIPSDQEQKKTEDGSVSKLQNWGKLKKLIMLKRSIKALEGFRKVKLQDPQEEMLKLEQERVDLRRQMMDERKKAEQWMIDYAVQHIVTKLTPSRKKRVSMLVEAFEAVVPFPEV